MDTITESIFRYYTDEDYLKVKKILVYYSLFYFSLIYQKSYAIKNEDNTFF